MEVAPAEGEPDPVGRAAFEAAGDALPGLVGVSSSRVYLIEAPVGAVDVGVVTDRLLADPVNQVATVGSRDVGGGVAVVEVHYLPGVMDPVAASTRDAILELLPDLDPDTVEVRTGFRYDFVFDSSDAVADGDALRTFASGHLANAVVQSIHLGPHHPAAFEHGRPYRMTLVHVPLRDLNDEELKQLSRSAHLFLSLGEMRTIREYYREQGREPTDIELETFAQTWSEHCVHKTLKSPVRYEERGGGAEGRRDEGEDLGGTDVASHLAHQPLNTSAPRLYDNLLKDTIAAATKYLRENDEGIGEWLVSVFDDNSGIVRFDDTFGVCIKVETHNHPSAMEPYGGAATGIGGCIRDIIGTGLAARPVANLDVFCVAPDVRCAMFDVRCKDQEVSGSGGSPLTSNIEHRTSHIPPGVIPPDRILTRVTDGVRDYGNRMGIPTVAGAVCFDPGYVANPLVFAGCVGLIPLDKCFGDAQPRDRIIAMGGATGRDGIHGATFSSAELTDTHADEFSHAVQIGNPITQKKLLDVILRARDHESGTLFSAITDCGAGGFSSAIGEMGEHVGAAVQLDRAPLKYAGLSYTEIWISEAQERMVLAVPPGKVETLRAMCEAEDVLMADLGEFGIFGDAEHSEEPLLVLRYGDAEVGRLPMGLLHGGIPLPVREAVWPPVRPEPTRGPKPPQPAASLQDQLLALLAHPNIASKQSIIRQYDHEVQGGSVVKPLVGPGQDGPSDAAVLRPRLDSHRGIALGCGLSPHLSEGALAEDPFTRGDSYVTTLAAFDEAIRNVVCVGADPSRIAVLDNFCWPSCDSPEQMGTLVRAAQACHDAAIAYRAPFVSGKDSLHNQFTTEDGRLIQIPQTLLVTAMGIVPDTRRCVTMDAKAAGNILLLIGSTTPAMGGSHHRMIFGDMFGDSALPSLDLDAGPRAAAAVASLIAAGHIASAHDASEGGVLVAAAEMAFAGRVGLDVDADALSRACDLLPALFAETPARYLIEVAPAHADAARSALEEADLPCSAIGTFADHDRLTLDSADHPLDVPLDRLRAAWATPLHG